MSVSVGGEAVTVWRSVCLEASQSEAINKTLAMMVTPEGHETISLRDYLMTSGTVEAYTSSVCVGGYTSSHVCISTYANHYKERSEHRSRASDLLVPGLCHHVNHCQTTNKYNAPLTQGFYGNTTHT